MALDPRDDLNIEAFQIHDSPDVRAWPVSTQLTKLTIGAKGVHVEFSKQSGIGRWPDQRYSWLKPGDSLQYTLWMACFIKDAWHAAGVIEFWAGLQENGGDLTRDRQVAVNWFYDSRWGPLHNYQPSPGEIVAFFVTCGDQRGTAKGDSILDERSNVVTIRFPAQAGTVFEWPLRGSEPAPEPGAGPTPVPEPPVLRPPIPSAPPADEESLTKQLVHLEDLIKMMFDELTGRIDLLAELVLAHQRVDYAGTIKSRVLGTVTVALTPVAPPKEPTP